MLNPHRATVFAMGLTSPEGPAFDRQGDLFIVDWDEDAVYRVAPNGAVSLFVRTGGIPTGLAFHKDGRLFVADSGRSQVLAVTPDGAITVMAATFEGERLRGPNDLAFAPNGNLYFTDPKGTGLDNPAGSVYLLRPGGALERFAGGFAFPNGVMVDAAGSHLYLAETLTQVIHRFALDANGHAGKHEIFARLEGGVGPDGMAFDAAGKLYIAHYGASKVTVVDTTGEAIDALPTPGANPTNVAFGPDGALYATEVERGEVVRFALGIAGQALYGQM
ncbi:MAG: SMP-30/gluconolactonase/LRE family protein [Anaerolineae bacterium]|nr:SMP-30/gluconolactonase/LRE family protein [Anaerolineae bacterium]